MNKMVSGLALLTLVFSACASDSGADSTTSSVDAEPTTNSTTSAVTSTSTPPTTSTTLAPTTTTSLLAGDWAEAPVVTSSTFEGVLGWWDGSGWVQSENDMALPVDGGEDYQIALLGFKEVVTTGGPRVTACDIHGPEFDRPGVELADPNLLTRFVESDDGGRGAFSGVAISAPWELAPRPVVEGEASSDLEAIAVSLLEERAYPTDSAQIVQVVEADLDGDGVVETFVVAEDTELGNQGSDVYSILFATSPEWDAPRVVEELVISPEEVGFPASFRVGAVADLSGDGLMEVVMSGVAWENSWVTVYEMTEDGFESRIGAGCGV